MWIQTHKQILLQIYSGKGKWISLTWRQHLECYVQFWDINTWRCSAQRREKAKIYLCFVCCSIGREKRAPNSHLRYAATGKGATRHKLQQRNFWINLKRFPRQTMDLHSGVASEAGYKRLWATSVNFEISSAASLVFWLTEGKRERKGLCWHTCSHILEVRETRESWQSFHVSLP